MCEIHPRQVSKFILEFYTSDRNMPIERWRLLVMERVLKLEQEFNATGEVRAHIHELDE